MVTNGGAAICSECVAQAVEAIARTKKAPGPEGPGSFEV
jgi:hypothetical protein